MSTRNKKWEVITTPKKSKPTSPPTELETSKSECRAELRQSRPSSCLEVITKPKISKRKISKSKLPPTDLETCKSESIAELRQPYLFLPPSPNDAKEASGSKRNVNQWVELTEKLQEAPSDTRLAHQLRLAMHEGGSMDPRRNRQLKRAIREAREKDIPMATIRRIIQRLNPIDPANDLNLYLLQIRYQVKVFLICTVQTENVTALKNDMSLILKKNIAGFVNATHMFRSSATIEALVSHKMPGDFANLGNRILRDAYACKATNAEVVDYETGAIHFKCAPSDLPEVYKALVQKGYKIIHMEYSFRPKLLVQLDDDEQAAYKAFLRKLRQFDQIVRIYDNVERQPE